MTQISNDAPVASGSRLQNLSIKIKFWEEKKRKETIAQVSINN